MKDNKSIGRKGVIKYAGIGLIVLSFIFYGGIFVLPFTPMSMELKGIAAMGLVIAGEASFWIGALIVGKEVASGFRSFLKTGNKEENAQ
jgi:hypothetical protein